MHTRIRSGRIIARLLSVVLAALLVAACSGSASKGVTVNDPWARNSPKTAGAGAAYMVIENTGSAADTLVGGSSDIAKAVEVHETYEIPAESPAMGGAESPAASEGAMGSSSPMMGMRKIDSLAIPAGGSVELKPGGYHIMLIDLTRELKAGDKFDITLKFANAGDVKVTAEVREG